MLGCRGDSIFLTLHLLTLESI